MQRLGVALTPPRGIAIADYIRIAQQCVEAGIHLPIILPFAPQAPPAPSYLQTIEAFTTAAR